MPVAAFGENFTSAGLLETAVCIGDVFKVGSAVVQVSQPRQPCFKLAARHDEQSMVAEVVKTGYTGFYFRCLTAGWVERGDRLAVLARDPHQITVHEANTALYAENDVAKRLAAVEALSTSWRSSLVARLQRRDRKP